MEAVISKSRNQVPEGTIARIDNFGLNLSPPNKYVGRSTTRNFLLRSPIGWYPDLVEVLTRPPNWVPQATAEISILNSQQSRLDVPEWHWHSHELPLPLEPVLREKPNSQDVSKGSDTNGTPAESSCDTLHRLGYRTCWEVRTCWAVQSLPFQSPPTHGTFCP
jgi:hypothetical protein